MTHRKHIIALLLAGGSGARMNAKKPKQYLEVDGEPIILHTMRAFQKHPLTDAIYAVCNKDWDVAVCQEAKEGGISKFAGTISGGETGFDSLRNGINYLLEHVQEEDAIVMVHDAVRPLITQDIISRNIAVCMTHGNAITALGSHEAFLISKDGITSETYLPREELMRAQTPHTFPLKTLGQMMRNASERNISQSQSLFTLANEVGITPLYIAQGELINFKLTHPSDIIIYQALKEQDSSL